MDTSQAVAIARKYAQHVNAQLPSQVVLYGSCANGSACQDSDIDIAVIVDGFTGNWLETSARLWALTLDVDPRIEPIMLDRQGDRSGFLGEVMRTGIPVN